MYIGSLQLEFGQKIEQGIHKNGRRCKLRVSTIRIWTKNEQGIHKNGRSEDDDEDAPTI